MAEQLYAFNTFGGAFPDPCDDDFVSAVPEIYEYDKSFLCQLFYGICRISDPSCDCILRKYRCLSASGSGIPYYVGNWYAECYCDDFPCKYGRLRELKNNRRDESVIFSMQTFVVKLASGVAALAASIVIQIFQIKKDETAEVLTVIAPASRLGLRMCMTIISDSCIADRITCVPKTLHINRWKDRRNIQNTGRTEESIIFIPIIL